jgi:hypothetical protein
MTPTEKRAILLGVLAAGARAASRTRPGVIRPDAVSMRSWNAARPLIADRYGWSSLAQEIRRQINAIDGRRDSWRELLREALADGGRP